MLGLKTFSTIVYKHAFRDFRVNGELLEALPLKVDTRLQVITTLFDIILDTVLIHEERPK